MFDNRGGGGGEECFPPLGLVVVVVGFVVGFVVVVDFLGLVGFVVGFVVVKKQKRDPEKWEQFLFFGKGMRGEGQ